MLLEYSGGKNRHGAGEEIRDETQRQISSRCRPGGRRNADCSIRLSVWALGRVGWTGLVWADCVMGDIFLTLVLLGSKWPPPWCLPLQTTALWRSHGLLVSLLRRCLWCILPTRLTTPASFLVEDSGTSRHVDIPYSGLLILGLWAVATVGFRDRLKLLAEVFLNLR